MSNGHDSRYKWVFSHPSFVKKFLQSFVPLSFVKKLDFDAMERVDKEFVSEEFRSLESDIVYKIPYCGSCIYIFLLIEFQSTVDSAMPLRFLRYTGELYRFAKPNTKTGLYPAAFPVLLYNGDEKWHVAHNVANLIEKSIPSEFIPNFRYFPVLINEFSRRTLVKIRNAVSAIFYIENSRVEELEARMDELVTIIKDEETESLRVLAKWFIGYLRHKAGRRPDTDTEKLYEQITSPMEVKTMFATKLREHEDELLQQGRQEGRQEGMQLGMQEKAIEAAHRMKAKGYTVDDIAEITGLSKEQIEAL